MDIEHSDEIWKDICLVPYHQAAWPFHQISNHGRVRVLPGGKNKNRLIVETELRILTLRNDGYMMISRGSPRSSRTEWLYIHHIVLNTFYGPCPEGLECRHLNGNRSDNRWPENLEWGTKQENYKDRIRHGTDHSGERNPSSKFTEAEISEIRKRPESSRQLAAEYGVHFTTIIKIRSGINWKHSK